MLLTSPDVIAKPEVSLSNGNCEVLITELEEEFKITIVVYNPPKPNFALNKFEEAVKTIENYIKEKLDSDIAYELEMMGDFNFPPRVTTFPNQKEGETDQKQAFQLLMDFTNEYGLTQVIDKPTQGNNILDLLFTNNPASYSKCTTKS